MTEIRLASESDREAIAEFARQHPDSQIEHTWEGSRLFAVGSGRAWRTDLAMMRIDSRLVGVMPVAVTRAGRLPVRLCRSAGGPLVAPSFAEQ